MPNPFHMSHMSRASPRSHCLTLSAPALSPALTIPRFPTLPHISKGDSHAARVTPCPRRLDRAGPSGTPDLRRACTCMLSGSHVHTGYADRWRNPGLPTPDIATCQQHGLLPYAFRPHAHKRGVCHGMAALLHSHRCGHGRTMVILTVAMMVRLS